MINERGAQHQQANHLYLTDTEPEDTERLPRLPPPPLAEQITGRLAGSGPERTAIELDTQIGDAGRLAEGKTLAELRAQRRQLEATGGDTNLIARAERLVAARVAWAARRNPPPEITAHLPARPDEPHLRRRWETAVASAAVYRARWCPDPSTESSGWLLGATPDDPDQARQREEGSQHLRDTLAACYAGQLVTLDIEPLPEWAVCHLTYLSQVGTAGRVAPSDLASLYRRIESWRNRHGLTGIPTDIGDLTNVLLGPMPVIPAERVDWLTLARHLRIPLPPKAVGVGPLERGRG